MDQKTEPEGQARAEDPTGWCDECGTYGRAHTPDCSRYAARREELRRVQEGAREPEDGKPVPGVPKHLQAWVTGSIPEDVYSSGFFPGVWDGLAGSVLNHVTAEMIIQAVRKLEAEDSARVEAEDAPAVSGAATEAVRTAEKDETEPDGAWKFGDEVTQVFDDMLERSIPQYDVMRDAVTNLAVKFCPRGGAGAGVIVDLGASRGEALARIRDLVGVHARYYAVEVSQSMLAALRERWPVPEPVREQGFPDGPTIHRADGLTDPGRVTVVEHDLREGHPQTPPADVTLSVLTLQFTPMEHRQRILRDVWRSTKPGGALILVEKVLGDTAEMDLLMTDLYYDLKGANGYSPRQIERKRLSLEGVLVPVTARWNVELLQSAGFRQVDCFWRWMNFAGWIAVREG